jgi:hypothetical protein
MRSRSRQDFFTWFQESAAFLTSPRDLQKMGKAVVRGKSGVALASVGTLLLLAWNAQLVVSTGAGIGTMLLMYLVQDEEWRDRRLPKVSEQVQSQMESWNRPFVWSAIAGGSAAFLSYLALAAWFETDAHWLATGILLQGLMMAGMLGLGIRQALGLNGQTNGRSFDPGEKTVAIGEWVQMLSHPDATARLLAVRELTAIGLSGSLVQKKQVLEYFQLFLGQESEEMVKDAVWEGFERLGLETAVWKELRLAEGAGAAIPVRRISAVLEHEEVGMRN